MNLPRSTHPSRRSGLRTSAWIAVTLGCLIGHTIALDADLPGPAETLVTDSRMPLQTDGSWIMVAQQDLRRRDSPGSATDGDSSTPIITTTFQTTTAASADVGATATADAASSSPLPSPLDSNRSSNFTKTDGVSTCPAFIDSFLADPMFKQCYPFSLLLQGSKSFFDAEKSLVGITQVLDASCSANSTACTTYLNSLAKNLTLPANCGTDYNMGQPVAVQAYLAMVGYQAVYSATCLRDRDTSQYCFANAVTNLTTSSNVYFYYLPLNLTLPSSTIPSCSSCMQRTMNVYQNAAANRKQPIAETYALAAQQVNAVCGPTFVNETLPQALVVNDSGAFSQGPSWVLTASLLLATLHCLL